MTSWSWVRARRRWTGDDAGPQPQKFFHGASIPLFNHTMQLALALFVTGAAAFQAPSQSARSPIALEATRSEVAAAILGASALFAPVAAFAAR